MPEETIRPRTVSLDEEYVNEFTNNSSHDSFQTIDGLLEILQQHRGIKECASHENLKRINAVGSNVPNSNISIIIIFFFTRF